MHIKYVAVCSGVSIGVVCSWYWFPQISLLLLLIISIDICVFALSNLVVLDVLFGQSTAALISGWWSMFLLAVYV